MEKKVTTDILNRLGSDETDSTDKLYKKNIQKLCPLG